MVWVCSGLKCETNLKFCEYPNVHMLDVSNEQYTGIDGQMEGWQIGGDTVGYVEGGSSSKTHN